MDDSDEIEPHDEEKHGLEHGYTPPDYKRRKPLRRTENLSRRYDEMLYVQIGLGAVVLLLLLWFVYHIYKEKQRNQSIDRNRTSIERVVPDPHRAVSPGELQV